MIFLEKIEKLREAKLDGKDAAPGSPALIPAAAHPVLACMTALCKVVKGCFGYELAEGYKELIADYVEQLRELPALMLATCNSRKGFTWKVGSSMILKVYISPYIRNISYQPTWRTGSTSTRRGWASTRSRRARVCTTPSSLGCGSTLRCRQAATSKDQKLICF